VTGQASQVVNPDGGAVTQFKLSLRGGPLRRLRVELDGQALPGGGISLSHGRVILGTQTTPALYTGAVSRLQGGRLSAALRGQGNDRLDVSLAMRIDRSSDRVTGTATLSPAAGGR
jgi:hypothetical protein